MNLESVCLNEELKVIDGKAYAVISQLGRKRPVNGCQARIMIRLENTALEGEKKALTKRLSEINNKHVYYHLTPDTQTKEEMTWLSFVKNAE